MSNRKHTFIYILLATLVVSSVACTATAQPKPNSGTAVSLNDKSGRDQAKNEFDIRRIIADAEQRFTQKIDSVGHNFSGSLSDPNLGSELVLRAFGLLGINYKFGGNSPDTGFDCSGLVRYVFQQAFGLNLPRRSEEISKAGQSIATDQLKPGDLVFFNTLKKAFSHVGIYVGNNQFVHAPASGGAVRVESIDKSYWQTRFDGARRLVAPQSILPISPAQNNQAPSSTLTPISVSN